MKNRRENSPSLSAFQCFTPSDFFTVISCRTIETKGLKMEMGKCGPLLLNLFTSVTVDTQRRHVWTVKMFQGREVILKFRNKINLHENYVFKFEHIIVTAASVCL